MDASVVVFDGGKLLVVQHIQVDDLYIYDDGRSRESTIPIASWLAYLELLLEW